MRAKNIIAGLLLAFFTISLFSTGDAFTNASVDQDVIAKRRAQLEKDLARLEKLINAQQVLLETKQGERASLERDVAILNAEIEKAKLSIRAQETEIANLQNDIFYKEATILELTEKINREKESLAALVRRTAEIDDLSAMEVLFSEKTLSQFFEEYDAYTSVKLALNESFRQLETLKRQNEEVKQQLEQRQIEKEKLKRLKLYEQKELLSKEDEKVKILKVTKGEEERYQQLLAKNKRDAAQIRSELFELRGSAAIKLGDAIEYATFAGNKTGVRPALILGLLKQETRLGEFLGNGVWTKDMHPTRDRPLFKVITSTLGLDPNRMPVSAKPGYGWGGAMGPAQFIPSTWACYGGYINTRTGDCNNRARTYSWETFWAGPWVYKKDKDRLRIVRGKQSPSNPWDNQDAFIAAAILLKDNGADAGTRYAERLAAQRYFAGWANANNPAYAFYGDGVMQHADYFQKQIDTLKELEG